MHQGGKEGMMETDKNPEELYTEAKEILSLVGASPSESPSSTGGRRPPRYESFASVIPKKGKKFAKLK